MKRGMKDILRFWVFAFIAAALVGFLIRLEYEEEHCRSRRCSVGSATPLMVRGVCFCAEVPR